MSDKRRKELMAELHASKIPFVEFQDGQCSESQLKASIAEFCISRERELLARIRKPLDEYKSWAKRLSHHTINEALSIIDEQGGV